VTIAPPSNGMLNYSSVFSVLPPQPRRPPWRPFRRRAAPPGFRGSFSSSPGPEVALSQARVTAKFRTLVRESRIMETV
jgi:hypothetical protein